jgi:hypothetical protein
MVPKLFGQRKLFVPLFYLYLSQIGDDIATNVVCKITMNWFFFFLQTFCMSRSLEISQHITTRSLRRNWKKEEHVVKSSQLLHQLPRNQAASLQLQPNSTIMATLRQLGSTQNLPQDFTARKLWDISKDLRKAAANTEEQIFQLTDGRIGDIVEVFWTDSEGLHVSETPNTGIRFPPRSSQLPQLPQLFTSTLVIPTHPRPVDFDSHNTTLFFSPMMDHAQIDVFIASINDEEKSLIQRLAINFDRYGALNKTALIQFSELREVLLISEPTGEEPEDTPQLGPRARPDSQQVFFYLAPPTAESTLLGCHVLDVRTMAEKELEVIRKQHDAWPAGPITVDMAWIERDGNMMDTSFPPETYLDIKAKEREKQDRGNRQEEDEFCNAPSEASPDDSGNTADGADEGVEEPPTLDSGDGDDTAAGANQDTVTTASPAMQNLNLGKKYDPFNSRADTTNASDVEAELLDAIAESNRKVEEREKEAELREQSEESDNVAEDDVGW